MKATSTMRKMASKLVLRIFCLNLALAGALAQEVISVPKRVFGTGGTGVAAFSPDGKLIMTGCGARWGRGAGAFLWDAATGRQILRFAGPIETVEAVAFSPDGTQAASGSGQHVRLWNVATGEGIWHAQSVEVGAIRQVAFSPDGRTILSRMQDNGGHFVCLWDVATGQWQHTLAGGEYDIDDAAFSPDNSKVATACGDERTARIWDAATGQELLTLWGHTNHVTSVAFSPDGTRLLTGSRDGTARLWDSSSGALVHILLLPYHTYGPNLIQFFPNGDKALIGGSDHSTGRGFVGVWNVLTGEQIRVWDLSTGYFSTGGALKAISSIGVSSDGTTALVAAYAWGVDVTGRNEGRVALLDVLSGASVLSLPFEFCGSVWASLSPDDTTIMAITEIEWAAYNASTGEIQFEHSEQHSRSCVAVSPDGQRVASGNDSGEVIIWDISTGEETDAFVWPESHLTSLDFSPDGTRLLATGWTTYPGYGVSVWDTATGELLFNSAWNQWVGDGEFSPDGTYILTAGETPVQPAHSLALTLWDASTGTPIRSYFDAGKTRSGQLLSVAFSPDGTKVLSGANDDRVCIWETASGQLLHELVQAGGNIYGVDFSPDGKTAVTCVVPAPTNDVLTWDVETGQQLGSYLHEAQDWPSRAIFSPKGPLLTRSRTWPTTCKLWDPVSSEHLLTIPSGYGPQWMRNTAFSPDGKRLFTVSSDAVAMWELVPSPEIAITRETDGRIVLTWQNPSGGPAYILQQCPGLSSDDWSDVTVSTPGFCEITNPIGSMFYRLQMQ